MPAIPVGPTSKKALEKKSTELLKKIYPKALENPIEIDIETLYEIHIPKMTGVKTGYKKLPPKILGETNGKTMTSFVSIDLYNATDKVGKCRCRATIAHESSHCILHASQFKYLSTLISDRDAVHLRKENLRPFEDPEWQAWYLAGAIMMPKGPFSELYSKCDGNLYEMARAYNLNPSMVEVRAAKLGLN